MIYDFYIFREYQIPHTAWIKLGRNAFEVMVIFKITLMKQLKLMAIQ